MQLAALLRVKEQSSLRKFAVQEDDKKKMIEIFDNVEDARKRLMVRPKHSSMGQVTRNSAF